MVIISHLLCHHRQLLLEHEASLIPLLLEALSKLDLLNEENVHNANIAARTLACLCHRPHEQYLVVDPVDVPRTDDEDIDDYVWVSESDALCATTEQAQLLQTTPTATPLEEATIPLATSLNAYLDIMRGADFWKRPGASALVAIPALIANCIAGLLQPPAIASSVAAHEAVVPVLLRVLHEGSSEQSHTLRHVLANVDVAITSAMLDSTTTHSKNASHGAPQSTLYHHAPPAMHSVVVGLSHLHATSSQVLSEAVDFEHIVVASKSVAHAREKGKKALDEGEQELAVAWYSHAIDAAHTCARQTGTRHADTAILYSNRAEAFLREKECARALADTDTALAIAPDHQKSKWRRERALEGLKS
eukprot:jgi/Chlat1/3437/Chrsp23S03824